MPFTPAPRTKCAKCDKTVYPTESIRAANGTYHKGCLKCTVCNLTLNLKTCISHESKPYCRTHKPTVGHTQVASVTDQSAMKAPRAAARVQGISKDARMTFAPGRAAPGGRGGARGGRGGARGGRGGGAGRGAGRGAPAQAAAPVKAAAPVAKKPTGGAAGGYKPSYASSGIKVGGGGNKCPKCNKTVYANEQIKGCGKVWHKGCLKCTECGITLNLKTLQSLGADPYCKVHLPKSKATQVASVEMQNAMKAPKAARMAKGVDQTMRSTFAPGALNPINAPAPVNSGGNASDVQAANAPAHLRYEAPEPTPHLSYEERDSGLTGAFEKMAVESTADAGSTYGSNAANYDEAAYGGDATYDESYAEESYDESYAEEAYPEESYAEESYAEESYAEESYAEESYPEEAYAEEAYAEEGYAEEAYAEEAYAEEGYAEEAYAEEGYAEEGYAEEGYAEEGYAEEGYAEEYYEEGYEEGYGEEEYYEEEYYE